jgi:hypothetical protein
MNTPRAHHTATLLTNGLVLATGGNDVSGNPLASAELFDPARKTWTLTGGFAAARTGHAATLLPNGKVLVTGGATAELYDPTSGTWAPTTPPTTARSDHTATLLPDGEVLIAGGTPNGSTPLAIAEIYNPTLRLWRTTGTLKAARWGHSATLLPNGKVLVSAGVNAFSCCGNPPAYVSSTELYDPASESWTTAAPLNTARSSQTATLLANGQVLIAGGVGGYNSAELYDVGLGYETSWQPAIFSYTLRLGPEVSYTLYGNRFRGVSEASGGNATQNSSSDTPVVQLRALEGGQTLFLQTTNWSAGMCQSTPTAGLPAGYSLATMFVNGIPSPSFVMAATPLVTMDAGLRAFDGTAVIKLACEPANQSISPIRINKNGTSYGILLTPIDSPDASKFRVQTSSGIMALKRLP